MATIIDPPPWARMPMVRHGAGGQRTDVVCGYLASDAPAVRPAAAGAAAAVRGQPAATARPADWVRASIDYALQQTAPGGARRARGADPGAGAAGARGAAAPPGVGTVGRGTAGWPRSATRCSPRRWRRSTDRTGAEVDGRRPGPRGQRVGVAARRALPRRCSAGADPLPHRRGGCTSPATCSARRRSASRRSPAGSATSPRRRSAGRSSGPTGSSPQRGRSGHGRRRNDEAPATVTVRGLSLQRTQALGRLPWFAPFLRRARRLRPVLPMVPPEVDNAPVSQEWRCQPVIRARNRSPSTTTRVISPLPISLPTSVRPEVACGDREPAEPAVDVRQPCGHLDPWPTGARREVLELDPGADAGLARPPGTGRSRRRSRPRTTPAAAACPGPAGSRSRPRPRCRRR